MPEDRPEADRGSVLREHREFRRYWLGQTASVVGNRMRELTIAWLVLELTGSPLWLAGVPLARLGAMLALSAFAGTVTDRLPRRTVILLAESGSLGVSLALASGAWAGSLSPVLLLVASVILGALHAFEAPARNVLIHEMVSGRSLLPAVSMMSASQGAARVIGPFVAGVLIERVGSATCFLVDAASYAVLLGVVASLPRRAAAAEAGGEPPGTARAAFAHVLRDRSMRHAVLALLIVTLTAGGVGPMLPAIVSDLLSMDARGLGALQACAAVGALLTGLALGRRRQRWPVERMVRVAGWLMPLPVAVLAVTASPAAAAAAVFVRAALSTAVEAASNTRLQLLAPPAMRGRTVALYTIVVHLYPLGGWLIALTAWTAGLRPALGATAAAALAAWALAGALERASRRASAAERGVTD